VKRVAWALALLLGLQPVTTDIYLPTLPQLTRDLGATLAGAQLTMSALILAFGVAQLFWGPVADRLGRRPVLLTGLVLHVLASVGAVLAQQIEVLVAWRVLQGVALAAAVVCARAMLRDLYEPRQGAHVMSLGLSGLGVIAIAGPLLGGGLGSLRPDDGWRAALGLVAVFSAATLAFVALALPETLPPALRRRLGGVVTSGKRRQPWREIACHPTFRAWALLVSCSYGGLFTILAGSSFVYIGELGLTPAAYGLALASGSLAYLAGTFVCRRWVAARGLAGAVQRAAWCTLAAGLLSVLPVLAGSHGVWSVLAAQALFAFAHGVHQPCGQAGAVGPFAHAAGAASALAGFLLAVVAFAVGAWLGRVLDAGLLPYALGLGFWSLATALVALTLVRRRAA
jgi:DHA1 family bicyclomycin/chloramphenicol resistance-like MFS transporter